MTQVLARKWRPKTFTELVGQEHVVRALSNALTQQRLHHAYLFTGTRGVGKTTLARIIAKSLNCETGITADPCGVCGACTAIAAGRFVDLIELDAASNTQVDNMRELLENAMYAPTLGRFKVYIIDEVHMLSRPSFNAMLKTLEEPPSHVKFILATTDPQKIPVTVLSRCLQFNLKQIPQPQIRAQLAKILELESIAAEDEALAQLARAARGSMRDALSLLDQAIAHGGGRVETQAVRAMLGGVEQAFLSEILDALVRGDGAALVAAADRMSTRSLSFETALQELAIMLQRVALVQAAPEAIAPDDPAHEMLLRFAQALPPEDVQLYYQIALQGRQDMAWAPDDYAGFTMTLLRMLAFTPGASAESAARPAAAPVAESKKKPELTASASAAANAAVPPAAFPAAAVGNHDWPTLINSMALAGMEGMLAHNCEFMAWHADGRIELRVPQSHKHLAEKSYQDKLKTALEKKLGTRVRLEVTVGTTGTGTNGSATVAEIRDREQRQRMAHAVSAIDNDPFVRGLVENLDARVVAVKPMDKKEQS